MTWLQPQHLQTRIRLPSLPKGRASGCRRTRARKTACKNGPSTLMLISRPSLTPQNQPKRCQNLNQVLALSRAARASFQSTSNNSRVSHPASSRPTSRARASRQDFVKVVIEAASCPAMSARQKASSCPSRSRRCLLKPPKSTQTTCSLSRSTRCISILTYYPVTSQATPRPRRSSAPKPSLTT